ncbi:MAG: helix-turn-helix domain-containing protein [Oscillospiraceae bacterium]|nr:helix-turn-helix domain-containing protein [Oscillospiraceae bacterium]
MRSEELISFCRRFFEATSIPVILLENGTPLYASLGEMMSYQPQEAWRVYPSDRNPEFNAIDPDLEYGHVKVEGSDFDLFLGPVFTSPVTEELIRRYFRDARIPPSHQEQASELLYRLPIGSHPQFIRYLVFLHLCLNHQDVSPEDFYGDSPDLLRGRNLDRTVYRKENDDTDTPYLFESRLFYEIRTGNKIRAKAMLADFPEDNGASRKASSPLRQAKNELISLASKAAVLSLIPAGMDSLSAYSLSDLYMAEAEQMQTREELSHLRYIMVMDFCDRCGRLSVPADVSSEISRCMDYIKSHTNVPLRIDDVAKAMLRSPSSLMRRFKQETGMTINDYMTKCRLDEACELLLYSRWSLSEISSYLCFSSQAYFQNVFKRSLGMTPARYRAQGGVSPLPPVPSLPSPDAFFPSDPR